jgi:hypothetical protein
MVWRERFPVLVLVYEPFPDDILLIIGLLEARIGPFELKEVHSYNLASFHPFGRCFRYHHWDH